MSFPSSSYGMGLYLAAKDKDVLKEVYQDVSSVVDILDTNKIYLKYLSDARIDVITRKEKFKTVFKDLNPLLLNFLMLLVDVHGIVYLDDIFSSFVAAAEKDLGLLSGYIYSSEKLELNSIQKIEKQLERKYNRIVKLKNRIAPSYIGGFKVVVNDTTIDYSLVSSLNELKNMIIKKGEYL